jgi:hypothetical protein
VKASEPASQPSAADNAYYIPAVQSAQVHNTTPASQHRIQPKKILKHQLAVLRSASTAHHLHNFAPR